MNSRSIRMKYITELFRIIVGVTFLFSGFVKAVDPLGFTYKTQDYLISFDLVSLFPLALPGSIVMVVAELLIGLFLLLGVYRKLSTIAVTLFMVFFLPLTLWIAIANPVEDCGCFGDALIITNWQTFYKNIVLFVGAIVLFKNYQLITPLFSKKIASLAALFSVIFGFSFAIYNIVKLPVFDFRPFKIGSNILDQMTVDPDKGDVVENIFIYSKDGVEKEFTENNYPWDDSTWAYVDMETRLLKKGEDPKVEDFDINLYIYDEELDEFYVEDDITEDILHNPGYTFLMVSYFLEDMNSKYVERFVEANKYAIENDIDFYVLTSSLKDEIMIWSKKHGHQFQFTEADERVLKTMIRSNPGLILLHDGVVVNKWDDSDVPNFESSSVEAWDKTNKQNINFWTKLMVIFLLLFIPLAILKLVDVRTMKRNEL